MSIKRCILMVCVAGLTLLAQAQDDATMAALQEHMTPGDAHKVLAGHAGHWDAEIKIWAEPGEKPMVSKGTVVMDMVLGGRFLKTTLTSTMFGMPFTGVSYQGYDNTRKIYTLVWMDSSGTSMTYGEGSYNSEEKALYHLGAMLDPVSGQDLKYQSITRVVDSETIDYAMYSEIDGEEFKMLHIVYRRKL